MEKDRFIDFKKNITALVIFGFLISFHLVCLFFPQVSEGLNRGIYDLLFKLRYQLKGSESVSPYVGSINISTEDTESLEIGPWERSHYSRIISGLSQFKIKGFILDILLKKPLQWSGRKSDEKLVEAARSNGKVFLPALFYNGDGSDPEETSGLLKSKSAVLPLLEGPENVLQYNRSILSFPELTGAARGAGHIIVIPDDDGAIRRIPLIVKYKESFIPSLGFKAVLDFLNIKEENVQIVFGSHILLKEAVFPGGIKERLVIPIDRQGRMIINWPGPWSQSIPGYSFSKILRALEAETENEDLEVILKDKILLLADVSQANKDVGYGVLDNLFPLSYIHLTVINSILTESFIYTFPLFVEWIISLIIILIIWRLFLKDRSRLFFVPLIYFLSAAFLFLFFNIRMDILSRGFPLLLLPFLFLQKRENTGELKALNQEVARLKKQLRKISLPERKQPACEGRTVFDKTLNILGAFLREDILKNLKIYYNVHIFEELPSGFDAFLKGDLVIVNRILSSGEIETLKKQLASSDKKIPVLFTIGQKKSAPLKVVFPSGAVLPADFSGKQLLEKIKKLIAVKQVRISGFSAEKPEAVPRLKHPDAFENILTASPLMFKLFKEVERVAQTGEPVLITGESGTGKELIADAIHKISQKEGAFIKVNIAGQDQQMLSDVLYGHVKGAYTGALAERKGLIHSAGKGTLFMDEMGDMDMVSQIKLLRLLDYKEYQPLGSDNTFISNTRIIAATNQDLLKLVKKKLFREDLFFRFIFRINLPSLKERPEDLPLLVKHFAGKICAQMGKPEPVIPDEIYTWLGMHPFPGNIRELRNLVFDMITRHDSKVLSLKEVRKVILNRKKSGARIHLDTVSEEPRFSIKGDILPLKEVENLYVHEVLRKTEGNQTLASEYLGLSVSSVSRRLKKSSSGG